MVEISIIIPVYNRQDLVARAIRSCLNQTLDRNRFEIIVIDDGSSDNSLEEIKKYIDEIILLENGENRGLSYSRNRALKTAKGRYAINLDSDDYIHPHTLAIMLTGIELGGYDALACDYVFTDIKDNRSAPVSCDDSPIACGILFKRQLLIDIGMYDTEFRVHEERDLRIRFLEKYNIIRLPIPLYRYLQHDESLSNDKDQDFYLTKLKEKHDID
jgi:glycosyltransferase involved in cell wall biosynthesis